MNSTELDELRKLNFHELISVDVPNVIEYTFDEYRKKGYTHIPINGYCTSCEKKGCNAAKDDKSYQLTNISHGAHSTDFFRALKVKQDTTNWHQQPILFLYETPSRDYGIYEEVSHHGYRKHPSKEWYWIHHEQEPTLYPSRFRGGEYGGFVLSAIRTFNIANVYMTNLVKCGLNNKEGRYKGLTDYEDETIKNCYEQYLEKELVILKPKVIFAFGSAVEKWVKWFVKDLYFVQQLPHPAGRKRGFRDEHYRVLYFWLILRALRKVGIVQIEECNRLAELFLINFDE